MTTPTSNWRTSRARAGRALLHLMDLEPAYAELRRVHAASLDHAREKLYLFLSWLGGPPLYVEKHGHRACARGTCRSPSDFASATSGSPACRRRSTRRIVRGAQAAADGSVLRTADGCATARADPTAGDHGFLRQEPPSAAARGASGAGPAPVTSTASADRGRAQHARELRVLAAIGTNASHSAPCAA